MEAEVFENGSLSQGIYTAPRSSALPATGVAEEVRALSWGLHDRSRRNGPDPQKNRSVVFCFLFLSNFLRHEIVGLRCATVRGMIAFGIRERLIEKGPESLSDSELIALLLRTGFSEKSAIEMAEDLLHSSGSLPALLSRSAVDLENVKGLGRAKTCTLLASWELCRRFWTLTKEPLPKIETAEQAYLACADLGLETQEVVCGIFLNATFGVLRKQILFRGSLTESSGSQREILREALRWNAAYLVIAHNHPSGDIAPSDEDISFTEELTRASKWIRIPLIDHLIIGRGKYFSFADARALQRKKNRSPYLSVG